MRPGTDELSSERRRLAGVSSVVGVVAQHVDDMIQLSSGNTAEWLVELGAPAGWRFAHLADSSVEPSRIAVSGQQPDGGWDGCETINVFGFTGDLPTNALLNNAGCTLLELAAVGVKTHLLDVPQLPGATAVRSSGYFAAAGLWLWAQYTTYAVGSKEPGQGRLVEHAIFVESGSQQRLGGDITQLTRNGYQAFVAAVARS